MTSFFDTVASFFVAEAYAEEPAKEEEEQPEEGQEENKEEGGEGQQDGGEEGGDEEGGDDEEEEEEEEDEPVDPKEGIEEECRKTKECAPAVHHYEECVARVTAQESDEDFKGVKEDCVEEFFHMTHCVSQCAAPKLFKQLK